MPRRAQRSSPEDRASDRTLIGLAAVSLAGAIGIGIAGCIIVSATLAPFVVVGGFLVVAYNLELFGGRFHTDFWLPPPGRPFRR